MGAEKGGNSETNSLAGFVGSRNMKKVITRGQAKPKIVPRGSRKPGLDKTKKLALEEETKVIANFLEG